MLPLKCFKARLKNLAAITSKQRHECVFVCCSGRYFIGYNFFKFQLLVVLGPLPSTAKNGSELCGDVTNLTGFGAGIMPDACIAYGCGITAEPQKGIGLKKFHSGMIRALNVSREEGFDSVKHFPLSFSHKPPGQKREDKSLRLVAMVAKFPEDHKPKTSLKKWIRTVSNFNDLIQFHLTFQMLAKFSEVESERTVSKLRQRKRKFCVGFTYSIKQGACN